MNAAIQQNYEDSAVTTKEELISRLAQRLQRAEAMAAYCREKIEKDGAYIGDVSADLAYHTAEASVAREVLNKVLAPSNSM